MTLLLLLSFSLLSPSWSCYINLPDGTYSNFEVTTKKPEVSKCESTLENLSCDFELFEDFCGWKQDKTESTIFKIYEKPVGNRVTGIYSSAKGLAFLAAKLSPGVSAAMKGSVKFIENYIIEFYYLESTKGMILRACCDTTKNCPFSTSAGVTQEDRKWQKASFICPSETKTVLFKCSNEGNNFGVCGLDAIRLRLDREKLKENNRTSDQCP